MSAFENSECDVPKKLEAFTKYVRRQTLARFMVQFEIFKRQLNVKGSVAECGVHHGGGLMAWAKISATLEPYNYHRKIIGFDTFQGFPSISNADASSARAKVGAFAEDYQIYDEILTCVDEFDRNRFLNNKDKIELVRGDASVTIPAYVERNRHLLISLLYLDFDIYEPTVAALKYLVPRMPKGAIICFDEVNNPDWAGETIALMECLDLKGCELKSFEYEPNISYIVI